MDALRWILAGPISAALFVGLSFAIEWILGWIFKIVFFVMSWGTRYVVPSLFDFEEKVHGFMSFIFITCLSSLISASISGFIGGKICPSRHGVATCIVMAIFILPILIFSCCAVWNSEHWFYSSVWVIDMIIAGLFFVSGSFVANEDY